MKVIILAGGFGTRLSEETDIIPKPMVRIGNLPIIEHIMNIYSSFDHKEFYLALGYKSEYIKEYFLKYKYLYSDISIDLKNNKVNVFRKKQNDWKINLIDTGLESMTGGRLKRMREYVGNETFMLTYGDGLANIDIESLVNFHHSHGKIATVTAVRPIARFGELEFDDKEDNKIKTFMEKSQINQGWINGGFFVFNSEIFDYLEDDKTILERRPLESLAKDSELHAFKHDGFWQCMDTKRDKDFLNDLEMSGQAPWKQRKIKNY